MTENALVAQRIMQLRESKGYTLKDFASTIDMSKSTYFDKESGKTEITVNELYRFKDGLKTNVLTLLGINNIVSNNSIVLSQNNNGTIYFQPSDDFLDKLKKNVGILNILSYHIRC